MQFCSDTAWDQGIRPEMTVAEATTLSRKTRKCAPLGLYEWDPATDQSVLEALATQCHQFSPLVGIEAKRKATPSQPSSLLLDVTGSAPRLGGEQVVAQRIVDFVEKLGYQSRIGIAHTVGAAWAFAHATDHIAIVPTDQVTGQLTSLPIQTLRLAPALGDLLTQLGVRHVGQLLQLPRASLQARFGPELLLRIDQATGHVAEAILAHTCAPSRSVTRKLEHVITRRDAIEHLTRQMVEQLCERLVEHDQEAVQLQYRLFLTSSTTTDVSVGLFQATSSPQHIFDLLRLQLESTFLSSPVEQATLTATTVVDREEEQSTLFDTVATPAPRQLAHLIERLSSRLGAERVVSAHLSREPQIEMAYQYHALAGKRRRPSNSVRDPKAIAYTRPLLLVHPPVPLRVATFADHSRQNPPRTFCYRNQQHQTIAYWGPERIETGWWRGPTVRRDYFRVENGAGSRFWLFHDLRRRRWFLHGEFL